MLWLAALMFGAAGGGFIAAYLILRIVRAIVAAIT